MRFVSRHEDTQVYGASLPKAMTNQAMMEFVAYKTYYAIASGAEPPKSKKPKTKSDSVISSKETPSKKKHTKTKKDVPSKKKPSSKPKPTKKAYVKADRGKSLNVLSKVALSEVAQLKEATKQSKKDFHISQASGSGDGTDFELGVPDEKQRKLSGTDEGTGVKPGVPDVPKYDSESNKESWSDSGEEDDEDDTEDAESNDNGDDSDGNNDDDDDNDGEDDDDDDNDEHEKEEEENISEFTDKEDDEENEEESDDGENQAVRHLLFTVPITIIPTTIPLPPYFFNPLPQQTIPTPTPTTLEATTIVPTLLDFAFVFRFNDRVTNLERYLSEMKQVDQYAQAISSILAIVDHYMDNKLGKAIHKAIQSHNAECREEAQAEKHEYIDLVDSIVRTIIIEEVKTQLPQILHKAVLKFVTFVIELNDTESLEADVLARSSSQPKSTYKAAASLTESRDDKDKDQDPSAGSDRGTKRRKSSKEVESQKDPRSKDRRNPPTSFDELADTPIDFFVFVMNQLNITNLTQELLVGPAFNLIKGTYKSLTELEYHFKECFKATTERLDWHNLEGKPYSFDLRKPLPLIQGHRGHQVIPQDYFINNDLEYLKVTRLKIMKKYDYSHLDEIEVHKEDLHLCTFKKLTNLMIDECYDFNVALHMFTGLIVIQRRVEDLQLSVESYEKKINLTKPDAFRSNLRNRTAYTAYSNPRGVIYKDQNNINKSMWADKLHKFSDGTLNDVQTALYDIASRIRMEYLPKETEWIS
nr:hypothetical protein [Tanacetum cinerariifolium]